MKPAGHLQIAPSLLSADFAALGDAIACVEAGGADLIHVDVMDGHFVPNITLGPPIVKAIRKRAHVPLDVHLMIESPDLFVEAFVEAGAGSLTVHAEAVVHLNRTIHFIKSLGVKAGVALNPSTPVGALEEVAGDVDYVLVMTVNPGFGGQTFIPRSESKVRRVRELLQREGNTAPIEVDGGIDVHTAPRIVAAGADILVAGNSIFNTPDPAAATRALRAAALESAS
ncbi:MAG TPA: ribulose-phosphate 3-epimerase [Vicinamibacterales bacterium]|jgi:ribulose-phosphate 3-epimerase|nr:ribulose-phosphate 3-epimerase [Vicinamibacterales bacterium]